MAVDPNQFHAYPLQTYIVIFLMCLSLAIKVAMRTKLSGLALMTWLFFIFSAVRVSNMEHIAYGALRLKLGHTSHVNLLFVMLVPSIVLMSNQFGRRVLFWSIAAFSLVDSVHTFFWPHTGFFRNHSFSSMFAAMVLPTAAQVYVELKMRYRHFLLPIALFFLSIAVPAILAYKHGGMTTWIVLAAQLGGYFFSQGPILLPAAAVSVVGSCGLGWLLAKDNLVNGHGRFDQWKIFFEWWKTMANHWVGTGGGTFEWIGPLVQLQYLSNTKPAKGMTPTLDAFIWMHNDWFQVLFENGIVGFSLFFLLGISAFVYARRYPWLFGGLSAAAVAMISQFPLRWAVPAIWIALLVSESVRTDPIGNAFRRGA